MSRAEGGLVELFCGVDARLREEVPSNLFTDKLVVRDVVVKRANEVIAIAPGLRDVRVAFAPMGIGVADQIHPVAGEVFAVAR